MDLALIGIVILYFCVVGAAVYRALKISNKIFITGELKVRKGIAYFVSILGMLGYLLLIGSTILTGLVVIGTFFFMKSGSASGVPLGLITIGFPIVWIISESLIGIGYVRVKNPDDGLDEI